MRKKRKMHDMYVAELAKINADIEVIEEYQGAHIPILHKCKLDGCIWSARPSNTLSGKGYPHCQESHGERCIRQWLEQNKMQYACQKTFSDCRNQKPLPFDFYLPAYNACIEYDGEQHFRPVDFFGGVENFERRKHNDLIKTEYCKDNNIRLLRIPYFKKIEEELEAFLFI